MSRIRVLHVDDDPEFVDLAAIFLERADDRLTIESVTSVTEALDMLSSDAFDCVVSDYDMPDRNGIEFLRAVRDTSPDLPFLLFTGKGSEEVASEAITAGVSDYLQKGSGSERYELLARRISNAVAQHRAERELDRRRTQMETLHAVTRELLVVDSETALASIVVDALEGLLEFRLGMVRLYDPERDGLVPIAYSEATDATFDERPTFTADGNSLSWQAFESGEPAIYNDVRDIETAVDANTPLRSLLILPLGEYGTMNAGSTAPGEFSETDLLVAKTLARNVVVAIERLRNGEPACPS